MILHSFEDAADGVESYVAASDYGFTVGLKDTDAGEVAGFLKMFADEAKAIVYAKSLVGHEGENRDQTRTGRLTSTNRVRILCVWG